MGKISLERALRFADHPPMRILFVHQNFPGQFRHVATALAQRGHEVVGIGVNQPESALPKVRHVVYRMPLAHSRKIDHPMAGAMRGLQEKIVRGEAAAEAMESLRKDGFTPDVVMAHSGWGEALFARDVFPAARQMVYAEFFYGSEQGDTGFDGEFFKPSPLTRQRIRIRNTHLLHSLNACDQALTATQFQKSQHPAWAQDRMQVIHEGIDTGRFRPDADASVHLDAPGLTFRPGDEVVTFVSRHLEPYRGYHIFMRALPLLQKLRPNAHVLLVGADGSGYSINPPPGQTWREVFLDEVRTKLDMSRIHFAGRLPHGVLTRLMKVSAVHVYLTYPFVLSWSLLEAMSIGCLVVASDTAPVREVIEHERNGLLTDFFDTEALAHRVADALANGKSLEPLRAAARETIVRRYDLASKCLPQQVALFEG